MVSPSPWLFRGEPVNDIPKGIQGFVYCIRCLANGKLYIGKKFTKSIRKVKGKTRRVGSESDWKDYWSSSDILKADVEKYGTDQFERRIIVFCKTRGDASRLEISLLWKHNVLEDPNFYNESIGNHKAAPEHIMKARLWDLSLM